MRKVDEERRRFPRANFLCKIIVRANKKEYFATTQNISSGGIRVILEDKLEVGTDTQITIFTSRQIECQARVVWVLPADEIQDSFDTGIEFTQISKQDKDFLEVLVDTLLSQHG